MKRRGKQINKLFLTVLILAGCSGHKTADNDLEIVIEIAQSCRYDLKNETFLVYYMEQPPAEIKFHLTDAEKEKISDRYFDLKLDKIPGKTAIDDRCMTMPRLYTMLRVKRKGTLQELIIDEDCESFPLSGRNRANRIKKFLSFVWEVLHSKPEIGNAPISDIIYL